MNIILALIFLTTSFAWLTPNHIFPWASSHSEFSIFLSLILLSIYTYFEKNKLMIYKKNLIFLFLVCIPIIQFLCGRVYFFGDAFISAIYILGFIFALSLGNTLGYNDSKSKKKIFIYFSFQVIFCCLICLYIELLQWLLVERHGILIADLPPGGRPFANFAQPNNLSTFLIIGVLSCLYLFETKILNKCLSVLLIFLLIFGVALTQSRTPWIYILCFLIWWYWKATSLKFRTNTSAIIIGCIWYLCCLYYLPILSNWLGVIDIQNISLRATSGFNRLNMWQQMLVAIKNEPWFGYGWNQVSVAQIENELEFSHYEWTEHTHNFILDLFIWNGIPLGILITIILIYWLMQFVKIANTPENFLALSMVGVVLVHGMLEYPLEYAFFLLPIGFLLGLVQASEENVNYISLSRLIYIYLIVVSISLYVLVLREYRIVERDIEQARFEALNIGVNYANYKKPNIFFLTQLREQIGLIRTQPEANMTEVEIKNIKKISYRYASSPALFRYAQVLALNNNEIEAKKHLLILEKLHNKYYSFESLYEVNRTLAFEWQNKSESK